MMHHGIHSALLRMGVLFSHEPPIPVSVAKAHNCKRVSINCALTNIVNQCEGNLVLCDTIILSKQQKHRVWGEDSGFLLLATVILERVDLMGKQIQWVSVLIHIECRQPILHTRGSALEDRHKDIQVLQYYSTLRGDDSLDFLNVLTMIDCEVSK